MRLRRSICRTLLLLGIWGFCADNVATAQGTAQVAPQITSNGGEIQQGEFGGVFSTIGEPLAQDSTTADVTDESTWVGFWHVMPTDSTMGVYEEWTDGGHGQTMITTAVPNPFRGDILLQLRLASPANVELKVFDVTGREVLSLVDGYRLAGTSRIRWEPVNCSAGVYTVTLELDGTPIESRQIQFLGN